MSRYIIRKLPDKVSELRAVRRRLKLGELLVDSLDREILLEMEERLKAELVILGGK